MNLQVGHTIVYNYIFCQKIKVWIINHSNSIEVTTMKASIKAFTKKKKEEHKKQKSKEASTIGQVSPHPEMSIKESNVPQPI